MLFQSKRNVCQENLVRPDIFYWAVLEKEEGKEGLRTRLQKANSHLKNSFSSFQLLGFYRVKYQVPWEALRSENDSRDIGFSDAAKIETSRSVIQIYQTHLFLFPLCRVSRSRNDTESYQPFLSR